LSWEGVVELGKKGVVELDEKGMVKLGKSGLVAKMMWSWKDVVK